MNRKFKVGDRLVVTGDVGWGHGFIEGTKVTTIESLNHSKGLGWRCEDDLQNKWYVAEQDLEYPEKPVTDEELAEVYESLGVVRT